MAVTDKDQISIPVNQHKRLAGGAWIEGEKYQEESKATMPKANSDHGHFESSAIKKDNA
jgi:hypothetical protein